MKKVIKGFLFGILLFSCLNVYGISDKEYCENNGNYYYSGGNGINEGCYQLDETNCKIFGFSWESGKCNTKKSSSSKGNTSSSSKGNTYRVLFDQNYGYGLTCDAPTSYLMDGVCAGNVNMGTTIKFPSSSKNMYRNGEGLLIGWTSSINSSGQPNCVASYNGKDYKNYIIPYDSNYKVESNVEFYACYHTFINGYRYLLEGGSADGQNLPCGSYLGITRCIKKSDGKEYCEYDMVGDKKSSGLVYRDKLTLSDPSASCKTTDVTEESKVDTINDYRYGVTEAIRDINFECGAKLYVTTCDKELCNFTKVVTSDGTKSSVSGTVNREFLKDNKKDATDLCPDKEEVVKKCVNNTQKKVKGTRTFTVCYSSKLEDADVKELINEKNLVSCYKGYTLDITSTRASGDEVCDSKNCVRDYTVECVNSSSKNPAAITISASVGNVENDGKGTVKIKASTVNGDINSFYISEEKIAPTSRSDWNTLDSGTFTVRMTPGVKYLWVKDSNGTISNPVTVSVQDKVNSKNTLKKLELYDHNNKLNGVNRISYATSEVSEYVMMSNKLEADNKVIAKGFNAFDHEYELEVDSPTITVYATLTSTDAKFVPGYEPRTVNLKYGLNTILIKILDNEGKERRYTILVTRTDNRNSDNTLNDLSTSVGKLTFNSNVTDYKVEIPKNTKSLEVKATINSDKASYVKGFEPGNILITGDTTVKLIKVKSQTGSTRTYMISFVKEGTDRIESKSLQLSGLTIPGVNVPFVDEVANYNLTVDYSTDIIDIYAPLKDDTSSILFSIKKNNDTEYKAGSNLGVNLDEGVNFIEIKITDKEGNVAYYRLTIIRKEYGLDVSNDTTLKDLRVLNYDIKFNPNKKEYVVKIKREKTLVITAVPTSNRAEVFIRGNDELTGFSTVRIQVVAENGQFETYSIDIKKDAFNKAIEVASIIAGAVIIIISSGIIIIKKKNKSHREYFEE